MMQDSKTVRQAVSGVLDNAAQPPVVDRAAFQARLDALRVREKAHTQDADAIAAARRRLPMVEVDPATQLVGQNGAVTLLDAFEGRGQLIAYDVAYRQACKCAVPRVYVVSLAYARA